MATIILKASEAKALGLKGTKVENVPMKKTKDGAGITHRGFHSVPGITDAGEPVNVACRVKIPGASTPDADTL